MSYAITIGPLHILPVSSQPLIDNHISCEATKKALSPSFVFSITSQIRFRMALHHLATCSERGCRQLQRRAWIGIATKLKWLLSEECLIGCVHMQSQLYGTKKVLLQADDFPVLAGHLASCPKESCAQLRRALLLTIREKVKPPSAAPQPVVLSEDD